MEDLSGKTFGPYRIVAPLGEGGMAAVFKAYQPAVDRYVALKMLPRHYASDPQYLARFQQEARLLAQLQHPYILPIFDFGEQDGYTFFAMPYIEGGTLADLLSSGTPLPLVQVVQIINQVGEALDYAHSMNVIHRDVKPSNVLIDKRGNCLLTDFGIAKMLEGAIKLTSTGNIIGTPAYMSPEQGMGEKVDFHSDIYSLGIILYEMATGRLPFNAETPAAILVKHITDPLPPPRKYNPDIPEALERVILKALAKNPEDRYNSAAEMTQALKAVITAHPQNTLSFDISEQTVRRPLSAAVPIPPPQPSIAPATPPPSSPNISVPNKPASSNTGWWIFGGVGIFGLVLIVICVIGVAIALNFMGNNKPTTLSITETAYAAEQETLSPELTPEPTLVVAAPAVATQEQKATLSAATESTQPVPLKTLQKAGPITKITGSGNVRQPELIFDEKGILHLLWYREDDNITGAIMHKQMDTNGQWSQEENISGELLNPMVYHKFAALNKSNGQVCVLWYGQKDSQDAKPKIMMRCMDGGVFLAPTTVAEGFSMGFWPILDAQNVVKMLTISTELYYEGVPIGNDKSTELHGRLALDPSGGLHTLWIAMPQNSVLQKLTYRSSKDGGRTWQDAIVLTDDTNAPPSYSINLMPDKKGNIHVAWDSLARGSVFYRQRDSAGQWQPAEHLAGGENQSASNITLSTDKNGNIYATWLLSTWDAGAQHVFVQYANKSGQGWNDPQSLADIQVDLGQAYQNNPSLVIGQDGKKVVAWVEADGNLYCTILNQ
jgi:serine/threonine protein kinase